MLKAIVYASNTGNTEAMAQAVKSGAEKSGAEIIYTTAEDADGNEVLSADMLLLGCPAMGDEELEDTMEEFFSSIEDKISGKKVALFGSYDWGDGEWIRSWADRVKNAGASMINDEGLACNLEPDEETLSACEALGERNE